MRTVRLPATLSLPPTPEHTAQHNCEGINRLEHRGRNGITKHIAVNEAVDIKANRATALLCEGPEQHTEEGERHNQPQLLPLFLVFCFAINFASTRANNSRDN